MWEYLTKGPVAQRLEQYTHNFPFYFLNNFHFKRLTKSGLPDYKIMWNKIPFTYHWRTIKTKINSSTNATNTTEICKMSRCSYVKFVALKVLQWLDFLNQVLRIKWLQTYRLMDSKHPKFKQSGSDARHLVVMIELRPKQLCWAALSQSVDRLRL